MPSPIRLSKLYLAILLLAGCLAFLVACQRKQPPKYPHTNIDSLRDSLQRAAASSLPTPTLTSHRFELTATPGAIAAKASMVASTAKELNGTVLTGPTNTSEATFLISLPANKVAEFARKIGVPVNALPSEDPSQEPVMVDVRITPPAE